MNRFFQLYFPFALFSVLMVSVRANNPRSFTTLVATAGATGTAGVTYFALTNTNLSLQISQWTPFYSNTFDASGNFACSNIVSLSAPQKYFTVQVP